MDWNVIREEYIRDESSSYRKLSEKYSVGVSTICKRAKAENWAELREQIKNSTITKSIGEISDKKARQAKKYSDMVDKMTAKLSAAINKVSPTNTTAVRRLTASLRDLKDLLGIKCDEDSREQETVTVVMGADAEKYAD